MSEQTQFLVDVLQERDRLRAQLTAAEQARDELKAAWLSQVTLAREFMQARDEALKEREAFRLSHEEMRGSLDALQAQHAKAQSALKKIRAIIDKGAPPLDGYWDGYGFNARGVGGVIPQIDKALALLREGKK